MKRTATTDAKVKEMINRIPRAGIAVTSDGLRTVITQSLGDKNEAEGVGQDGADRGNSKGEGAAQRAVIDYLLAKPRLAEALDNDTSRVVQCTGQECSPTGSHTVVNPPHTQQWGRDSGKKDEGAGLDDNQNKDKGVGLNGNVIKDQGAGPDRNVIKDEPAGLDRGMIEDEPAGLDKNIT